MVKDKILSLLSDLQTAEWGHTGSSLQSHLRGTHDLLESWGNPSHVCLAGLFHSVYGTQSYKLQSVALARRELIRGAIGEDAELLVYLFCVAERDTFFSEANKPKPQLFDRVHQQTVKVSAANLRALIEIEVANYVEFLPRTAMTRIELKRFSAKIESAKEILSPRAYEAVTRSLSEKTPAG
jgi:hypothetical protein